MDSGGGIRVTRDRVDPICYTLLDSVVTLRAFVKRQIPKIEEGHNAGVDTINAVDAKLAQVETSCGTRFAAYLTSADIDSKAQKHPNVKDYQRSYEKTTLSRNLAVNATLMDYRDAYELAYDVLTKNLEVILCPRKVQTSNMY